MVEFGHWIGHNGAVPGYATHMAYLPERDVSVTVAVSEFLSGPCSGMTATAIWSGLVRQPYPGTTPGVPANTAPGPPVPAVADLDDRLRQTLGPAVPAVRKPLRIAEGRQGPGVGHSAGSGPRTDHHGGRQNHRRQRLPPRDRRLRGARRPLSGRRAVRPARRLLASRPALGVREHRRNRLALTRLGE